MISLINLGRVPLKARGRSKDNIVNALREKRASVVESLRSRELSVSSAFTAYTPQVQNKCLLCCSGGMRHKRTGGKMNPLWYGRV